MSVFFNGELLTTPQTASAVNDDAMLNQNLSVGNVLAVVGLSDGGTPQEVLSFSTPNKAREVLKGGELCDAVVAAFAPSSETGSPQTVLAVRVNRAAKGGMTLVPTGAKGAVDAQGNPIAFASVTTKKFDFDNSTIRIKVEKGTKEHQRTITVEGGAKDTFWSKTGTDLGGSRLLITNHSIESTLEISVDPVTGEWTGEVATGTIFGSPNVTTFSFNTYPTLGQLTDYLESLVDSVGDPLFTFQYQYPEDRLLPSSIIDPCKIDEVPTGAMPGTNTPITSTTVALTWRAFAVKHWFDENVGDYLDFTLDLNNSSMWSLAIEPMAATYLTFGATPSVFPSDWNDAIALLERKDVQWVHVVSGNPAIHRYVTDHVTLCSNRLRRERRAIVGTELHTTNKDAIAAAKAINSPRVSLVHLGHYVYNDSGKLTLRPAYMTAGLIAAGFAGVNPGTPLTNKSLAVAGWERDLSNPNETDELIKGGVLPVENTETGFKVTQSISTWLGDSKYNKREQSCGVAVDFAIRNVRQALDPLRGQKQSPILLSRAVSITKGALMELARPEPMGPAVLVGDENSPAWRNVTATVEGDVLRVQFEASPAIPNNYILVTMYAVPYSGSATA